MRVYASFAKTDPEQKMVYGYASTEALDSQGEIVTKEALAKALPDFMRFANIREMHQPSAVGRAAEANVDEKGLYIGARIADPVAWSKIKAGVYNGFSIAGSVTERDPAASHVITGCTLSEISLVDRPANPEAVFDLYKAGARNSQADLARIQAIHDQAAALGACCSGAPLAADEDDPEDDDDDGADATQDGIEKRAAGIATALQSLDRTVRDLASRLAALEARPLPAKGALRTVAKGQDLGDYDTEARPGDTHALIKAALAKPRSF
jgi:phage head maturation protease